MTRVSSMSALTLALALAACGQGDRNAQEAAGAPFGGGWTMTQAEGEVILSQRQGAREPTFVMTCRQNESALETVAQNPTGGPIDYSQTVRLVLGDQEFQGGPRTVAPGQSGETEQTILRAEFPLSPELLTSLARAEEVRIAFGGGEVTAENGAEPLTEFAGRCATLTGVNLANVGPSGEMSGATTPGEAAGSNATQGGDQNTDVRP